MSKDINKDTNEEMEEDTEGYFDEQVMKSINYIEERQNIDIKKGVYINNEFVTFSRRSFFDEKLSIMLPDPFVNMPEELAKFKYPSSDRPQIIMSNIDTTVNFTFTYHRQRGKEFKESFTTEVRDFMKLVAKKTNPTNEIIDVVDDVTQNTKVSMFSYRGLAIDMAIFYLNYVTCIDNYALFGTFNCPNRDMESWYPPVRQIIGSLSDETKKASEPEEQTNG